MRGFLLLAAFFALPGHLAFSAMPYQGLEQQHELTGGHIANLEEFAEYDLAKAPCNISQRAPRKGRSCFRAYEEAKVLANEYLTQQKVTAGLIANDPGLCLTRHESSQRQCLEDLEKKLKSAVAKEEELKKRLEKAVARAERLAEENKNALYQLAEDQEKIDTDIRQKENQARILREQGDPDLATAKELEIRNSPTLGGVSGSELSAPRAIDYRQSIPQLRDEVTRAERHATDFQYAASSQVRAHEQRIADARAQAERVGAMKAQLGPAAATLPAQGPVPTPRPSGITAGNGNVTPGAAGTTGSGLNSTGSSRSPGNDGGNNRGLSAGASDGAGRTGSSNRVPASSGNQNSGGGFKMPNMGGMGGMGAAGGGQAHQGNAGYVDPYAHNQGINSHSGNSQAQNPQNPNQPGPGVAHIGGKVAEDISQDIYSTEPDQIGGEAHIDAALSSGVENTSISFAGSGTSSTPGRVGNAGSSSGGTGVSVSLAGAAGGAKASLDMREYGKEPAAMKAFQPDLSSGGINLAGSEINAAIASLEQEFGALNLDFGSDLTEKEKAALAPLDGARSGGNLSRPLASMQSGREGVEAASETEDLFLRTKAAHTRAVQRGDLIRGVRSKL